MTPSAVRPNSMRCNCRAASGGALVFGAVRRATPVAPRAARRIREMRNLLIAAAMLAALSCTPTQSNAGVLGLLGFDCGPHNSCCAIQGDCGCGCEASCGCESCCEPACGCESCCEPCCGCGHGCFANGCQYAGQCFTCGCQSHAPVCPCVGCDNGCQGACGCGSPCGCGDACEPACGCGSCCEPACGCGSGCGCGTGCASWCGNGTACCPRKCCAKYIGFGSCCGHLINLFCCGSSGCGCSGERYWSEWHNDPPYCHDPCDCCSHYSGGGCGWGYGGCGCDGGCGSCNGGCSTGNCGCNGDGGYTSSQSAAVGNSAMYAKQQAAARTQVATSTRQYRPANQTRNALANPTNPSQQVVANRQTPAPQRSTLTMRTATRPNTNNVRPSSSGNQNAAQPRPIMW